MPPTNSTIAVHLNIGHKASHRAQVQGMFTHDWSAYVTGADGIDIHHFVEKVVFTLHETFERPVQVVTEPPYMICESGYASFGLKVDIHFNNKQCRPGENVIHYEYDLYLPGDGQPSVKHFRQERLLFKNTDPDFRGRLKLGGAKETDPEAIKESAREERRLALAATGQGGPEALARQSSLTDKHKSSDDEKKEKKKKHKDKSNKHKKSKSDREKPNKSSSSLVEKPAGSLFGLPRTSREERPEKIYQPPTKALSNSDSSSSSSSGSASPLHSPNVPATSASQSAPAKTGALSASDSSSDSDDNMNSSNNNSVNKRPSSASNNVNNISGSSKKSKTSTEKPAKKSERNAANPVPKATNGIPVELLLDLHEKIRSTEDSHLLSRFVTVVEESNQYKLTDTSFDFDLYRLDANTIHKLENIFK